MSATTVEFDLADLLQKTGARAPRSGRGKWDCGRCGGKACLSFNLDRGLYHCFHSGCVFSGNAEKLARELGLAERLTPEEYRKVRQNRDRADQAARALYERDKARRFELLDRLKGFSGLESRAHGLGPDNPEAWDALALVYRERPTALAELAILENCGAVDLIRFLSADNATRERVIAGVIERGGLYDCSGKFIEVCP